MSITVYPCATPHCLGEHITINPDYIDYDVFCLKCDAPHQTAEDLSEAMYFWNAFDQKPTIKEKEQFVNEFEDSMITQFEMFKFFPEDDNLDKNSKKLVKEAREKIKSWRK